MKIPTDRLIFEGEIATYWFEEGTLISHSKPMRRRVANIRENLAFVKRLTGNKRFPLLLYLVDSSFPAKEMQQNSKEQLPAIFSAMGMVSKPGLT